jgi:single-strand DNA-binding protein
MTVRPPGVTGDTAKQQAKSSANQVKDLGPGSLAGNLTKDPELRFTPSGIAVATLRVAVAERVQDPKTKEWTESPAEFFTVECWRALAEHVTEHLKKSHRIVAEGMWRQVNWTDKDGEPQEKLVFAARELGPSLLFTGARVLERAKGDRS